MVTRLACLALAATLAACADASTGQQAIDVIGTPFYIALKIPVCAATIAIAAPLAGLAGLADPSPNAAAHDPTPDLDHGVTKNCGGPWTLTSANESETR